uniref:Uncharacterized protein n=1 Tax=Romanomermis culicivorax TaxID=13658 RepID=A0A915KDQ7_ROMCU
MKVMAKQECRKFSKACRKTGGGNDEEPVPTEISEKIQSMISEQMGPMIKDCFDNDVTDDGSKVTDEQLTIEEIVSEKREYERINKL